jgi:hypothetical protein
VHLDVEGRPLQLSESVVVVPQAFQRSVQSVQQFALRRQLVRRA